MPAQSKQQQKFMGIVRSIQKGDQPASKFSKKAQDAADDMKEKDVEKFASTKHKGLPKKVEQALREKIRTMVEDYVESCGYVVSAKDPNYKLKSPGGTGEEDRELKENAGVPNKMRAGFKKLKNKEGLSIEERDELYKVYKGIVELMTYGNFYDNKKPNKRRKELSELTFDINYALVGSKRLGSYQGRFEKIFKKFLNMINTQIKREEKGLKTDYKKAMRASKLDDVKNIFKNVTKYARTQKGIQKGTNEGFGSDEFLTKTEKKKFEKERLENAEVLGYELTGTKDLKESTIQEKTFTPIHKIKNIKNIVKKGLVSYRGTGGGFEISIRNKKVPGFPPAFSLLQKDGKKYKDIMKKQFKIKPVKKFFIKSNELTQLKKFGTIPFLAPSKKESVNESKKEKDQIIKYLQGLGFDERTAKKAVAKSYNYISKAYRNTATQYKGDLIARILKKNESVFAVRQDKIKNGERFPKKPNFNYDPEKGKSRIKKVNEAMKPSQIKKMRAEFERTGELPPHLKKFVKDVNILKKKHKVKNIVVPGLEWMSDMKEQSVKEDYKNSGWEVYLKDEKGREKIVKKAKSKRAATILYNKIIKSDKYYEVGMRAIKESVNEARLNPKETIKQLGGNRFLYMVGAKNLAIDKPRNELHMKIMRNAKGVSHVVIKLTSLDLYDMKFLSLRAGKIRVKATEKGVYGDQLATFFKKHTGLNTRL